MVIVLGLPGTGKSYFAARLAEQINAVCVNSDRLRKELIPVRTYSDKEKEMVYRKMLEKTRTAINVNTNVVLDATFYKSAIRNRLLEEIRNNAEIFFIEITAREDLIRRRLQKERPYSDADFKIYKIIRQEWEPLNTSHLILNSTDDNINDMLQKAMDHLQKKK